MRKQPDSHFQNHLSIISMSCPMAFMCRSARVQRWSAGGTKNPLFQTPTVSGNCKGATLHTSAHFPILLYHKMCVLTVILKCYFTKFHVSKHAQWYSRFQFAVVFFYQLQWLIHFLKQIHCICRLKCGVHANYNRLYISWKNISTTETLMWSLK